MEFNKEKTFTYNETLEYLFKNKKITEEEMIKLLEEGKFIPMIKNHATGKLQKFKVTKINKDGSVLGGFI